MRKFIVCLISLALIGGAFSLTAGSNTATAGTFNSTPIKVLDTSNATTGALEADWLTTKVDVAYMTFGPGTDNTTVMLWGLKQASGAISAIISRKLNTNQLNLTSDDGKLDSVGTGADNSQAVAMATGATFRGALKLAVGPGMYAVATGQTGGGGVAANPLDTLVVYLATSSAVTTKTVVVSTGTTYVSGTTAGVAAAYVPLNVWYEDGQFYVIYEVQASNQPMAANSVVTLTTTGINLQGVNATGNLYTAPIALYTASPATTPGTLGTATITAIGGGNNYTNSTMILAVYKLASNIVYGVSVTRAAGTYAGTGTGATALTAGTPAALSAADTTGNSAITTYPAGILSSNGTGATMAAYGYIVATYFAANTSTTFTAYVNGTTSSYISLGITTSSAAAGTNTMATGFRLNTGYGVIATYPTGAATANVVFQSYYGNNTVNTTQATVASIATGNAPFSAFADVNGAVWAGYVNNDGTNPTTAYIGKLLGQVNTAAVSGGSTTSGSILVTMTALISFVIVSLFMF